VIENNEAITQQSQNNHKTITKQSQSKEMAMPSLRSVYHEAVSITKLLSLGFQQAGTLKTQ